MLSHEGGVEGPRSISGCAFTSLATNQPLDSFSAQTPFEAERQRKIATDPVALERPFFFERTEGMAQLSQRLANRLAGVAGRPPGPLNEGGHSPSPVAPLIARADAARDEGKLAVAAELYAEALRLQPELGPIHVQAGHMFKETGDYAAAERHYDEALRLMPDDADLALQLGHFHKLQGRLEAAHASYARAVRLAPGWSLPEDELESLRHSGWRPGGERQAMAAGELLHLEDLEPDGRPDELKLSTLYGRMAPELMPRPDDELLRYSQEEMAIRQMGVSQNTYWGHKPVVRGIEAIRGAIVSVAPVVELQAHVNGLLIHRGVPKGPYLMEYEPEKDRIHKYCFNIWHDFSAFREGHYRLDLTVKAAHAPDRTLTQWFVVEPALLQSDYPDSDGVISLPPGGEGSLEEQISAQPSAVHQAWRPNQLGEVRNILVARSDQLGDLIASIPAIRRLREIFPAAKIVGVFTPANHGLARTLDVFDDIIILDHAESWHQRNRLLTMAQQIEFRDRCAPYKFDIAMDLSQSQMSRPMLHLAGARFTYGFKDPNQDRLSSSYEDLLHDPKNRRETAAHSKRLHNLVERLWTATHPTSQVLRRDDISREQLAPHGVGADEPYAVLHGGARIVWSRWRHLIELAEKMLAETQLKIVFFAADAQQARECEARIQSERFVLLKDQLPFDDFDALLSFASVFVGNDSGPKHLASLRGTPVVSIHSARINWSEWGQELTGVVITRRVPCAGCHLYHDPEECGKDYACMKDIKLDEVYEAVRRYV